MHFLCFGFIHSHKILMFSGQSSRKFLRIIVTTGFQLTYSKNGGGGIWGRDQNDKYGYFFIFLHKIICCGCVLESPHRADSNTHPKHMILWELMIIKVKHWSFVKTLGVRRRSSNDSFRRYVLLSYCIKTPECSMCT